MIFFIGLTVGIVLGGLIAILLAAWGSSNVGPRF
jgi:hypothetical protein